MILWPWQRPCWIRTLPAHAQQSHLVQARRQLWRHGIIAARVDRNPGRLVVLCRELWAQLQRSTFLNNERYSLLRTVPSHDDVDYAKNVRESFLATVAGSDAWCGREPSGTKSRPKSYWTVKQKSLIESVSAVVLKLRPLVVHCVHPLRITLSRTARASAILVCEARMPVLERRPTYLPMWQPHSESRESSAPPVQKCWILPAFD